MSITILVAEDELDIRELIAFTLQLSGYTVVQAPNGEVAVQKAQELHPDLIMLDVRMPKVTGFDACKQIKANPATSDIPVIFLSAKGQETEIKQGTELGAEAYILKPFAPDELVEQVKSVLMKYDK